MDATTKKWNQKNTCSLPKVRIKEFNLNLVEDIEKQKEVKN